MFAVCILLGFRKVVWYIYCEWSVITSWSPGKYPLIKHINIYAAKHRNVVLSQVAEWGKESQVRGWLLKVRSGVGSRSSRPWDEGSRKNDWWGSVPRKNGWTGTSRGRRLPAESHRGWLELLLSGGFWKHDSWAVSFGTRGLELSVPINDAGCKERRRPPHEFNPGFRAFHSQNFA